MTLGPVLIAQLLTVDLRNLAVGPELRAINLISAHLLTIGHSNLLTIVADLLPIGNADLLAVDALRIARLAFHTGGPFNALSLSLYALSLSLGTRRPLDTGRAFLALLAFRALSAILPLRHLHAFRARRTRLAFSPLRPLRARRRLALDALGTLRTLAAATAIDLCRLSAAFAVGFRTGRGRNRQRGCARCEDYPGKHVISPFER